MPGRIKCGDGIAIGLAGADMGIVEGWADHWIGGGDAPPWAVPFAAIDCVAGQVCFDVCFPTEVDGDFSCGLRSDRGQAGGNVGRKDVGCINPDGIGERAGKFEDLGLVGLGGLVRRGRCGDCYADNALGAVFIGLAEADVFIDGARGFVGGVDQERLLERLRLRGEQADLVLLLRLGGGDQFAMESNDG